MTVVGNVTQFLKLAESGHPAADDELLPLLYQVLRLVDQKLAQDAPGHALQATALVHEAYLRLVGTPAQQKWDGRRHFFSAAAEAMRRILVQSARRRHSQTLRRSLRVQGGQGGGPGDMARRTGTRAHRPALASGSYVWHSATDEKDMRRAGRKKSVGGTD